MFEKRTSNKVNEYLKKTEYLLYVISSLGVIVTIMTTFFFVLIIRQVIKREEAENLLINFKNHLEGMVKSRTEEISTKVKLLETQKKTIASLLNKSTTINQELEKFKMAVENTSDHIAITDPDGIIIYANKSVERITGFSDRETIGKKAGNSELWGGLMSNKTYESFWKQIKENKKPFFGTFENKRKNGLLYNAATTVSPILDEKGNVIFFIGIERDVTSETEAFTTNETLAKIVESSEDAIYSKDINGKILTWNKGAEDLYGYKKDEIIGQQIEKIVPKNKVEELNILMEKLKKGHNINLNTVRLKKNMELVDVSISASPITDKAGKIHSYSVIARDITKERKIDQAKTEFVSLASHQLRTPATGVKQFIGMLKEGYAGKLTKEQKHLVEDAYKSNERQLRVISDLLETARIEAGKASIEKKEFNLTKTIENVILEQKRLFYAKKQIITFEKPSKPIYLIADETKIRMVFDNLVNNANKYTPDGGKVTIILKEEKNNILIFVKDNGVGISKKDQSNLFDKFFRVKDKGHKDVEGSGLGLFIVKRIVALHKGTIDINSEIDKGTTFVVRLPKKGVSNGPKNSHS